MGKLHVNLYEIWTTGSGGDVVQRGSLRTHDGSGELKTLPVPQSPNGFLTHAMGAATN